MQKLNQNQIISSVIFILTLATLACGSASPTQTPPVITEQEVSEPTTTPTVEAQPTQTLTSTPMIKPVVDVYTIIGKPVDEVENILGETTLITPIDDINYKLYGGEFRDYEIGNYAVFVTYDPNGTARVFQILDGLSSENYSITDWGILLAKFGIFPNSLPDREAPAAVYWDDDNGYFIAVFASSSSGTPVWSVQISEVTYKP